MENFRIKIELSASAIDNNIKIINKYKNKNLGVVIKGNAYGHGAEEIYSYLKNKKEIDYILFAYEDEFINNFNDEKKVLFLSPYFDEYFFKNNNFLNLEYSIYSIESLNQIIYLSKKYNKKTKIQLKINTGMNRFGFKNLEVFEILEKILSENNFLELTGIFTHCFDSNRECVENLLKQKNIFNNVVELFKNKNEFNNIISHIYSSGGIEINESEMIRCGSSLYGIWKSEEHKKRVLSFDKNNNYKQVLKLKAKLLQINNVEKGEFIGYGISTIAESDKKIGIVGIGYADGLNSALINNIKVIVNGKYSKQIGSINMNNISIDLTEIENVKVGDDVLIFSGDYEDISIEKVSSNLNINPLILTTMLNKSIKRVLVN